MTEDSPTPLLTPGTLLKDRWEVVKKIGGGGFGEIYKSRDIHSGEVSGALVVSRQLTSSENGIDFIHLTS